MRTVPGSDKNARHCREYSGPFPGLVLGEFQSIPSNIPEILSGISPDISPEYASGYHRTYLEIILENCSKVFLGIAPEYSRKMPWNISGLCPGIILNSPSEYSGHNPGYMSRILPFIFQNSFEVCTRICERPREA